MNATIDLRLGDAAGAGLTSAEIAQQPGAWRETADALRGNDAVRAFLEPLVAETGRRIVLTGAGTSALGGAMIAPLLSRHLGRPVEAVATTDLVSRPFDHVGRKDRLLLVSFARSGNSPESIAATELADAIAADCRHLVVTCAGDGQLAVGHAGRAGSHVLLMPERTNDRGFAMTSSITSMMLATLGAFVPSLASPEAVETLAGGVEQVLEAMPQRAADLMGTPFDRIVYLGSGSLRALAEEAALKILELTGGRVLSYHETPLGFRHGPKSLLTPSSLVVVLVSADPHARLYDLDILGELGRQLGPDRVLAFAPGGQTAPGPWQSWSLGPAGAETGDERTLLFPYLVAAQLVALHASVRAGRTPDNPFPGGEVNRVVQGVTIHPLPQHRRD